MQICYADFAYSHDPSLSLCLCDKMLKKKITYMDSNISSRKAQVPFLLLELDLHFQDQIIVFCLICKYFENGER